VIEIHILQKPIFPFRILDIEGYFATTMWIPCTSEFDTTTS
jgi:hypothetical protein